MKTLNEFITHLHHLKIKIWTDGEHLKYSAPKGALSTQLRAELTERKKDLLKFLNEANLSINSNQTIIKPAPEGVDFPPSLGQRHLWFLDKLGIGGTVYNLSVALRLQGVLQVSAFEQSINEIVKRHNALRTIFVTINRQPIQKIASYNGVKLPVKDLSSLSVGKKETEIRRLAREDAHQAFNLAKGPLYRVSLLKLSNAEYIFLLAWHHIISDGWSQGVFMKELSTSYNALVSGKTLLLPDLPIQYSDFAFWQNSRLQDGTLKAQKAYWQEQLTESVPALLLPIDHPYPKVETFRGTRQSLLLPQKLTEGIKMFSQQESVTLFITLVTAFKALLYCYTQQEDIIIGSPTANRNQVETEDLIGYFNNIILMRTRLEGQMSFLELLHRVRQVAFDGYKNQDFPFHEIASWPSVVRTPLCRGMVDLVLHSKHNARSRHLDLSGITVSPLKAYHETVNFDLFVVVAEKENGLNAIFQYKTALFDDRTITHMMGHFQKVLECLVINRKQKIATLPIEF